MPPRFLERMQRQSAVYKSVFEPPAYSKNSRTSTDSSQSQQLTTPPPSYHRALGSMGGTETLALPKDSLILVTGANSCLGIHVVDQLLEHGYRVRGAVRDAEKAIWTSNFFREKYGIGRYTTAVVPDMARQGAYDPAVNSCAGVVHVASVMSFSPDPSQVIPATIAGAINALEAAAKEPMMKRFVYCSSITAAVDLTSGLRNNVTSESWNMSCFQAAWNPPPYEADRAWAVFAASKMQTEQAVWRWSRERRPHFALNCVLPDMLWGKRLDAQNEQIGIALHVLKNIFKGHASSVQWTPPQYFSDVQDAAALHVATLILPGVVNERIFVATTPYNINSILQLLRGIYPDMDFGPNIDSHGIDSTQYRESNRAEELLRLMGKKGWTDMETSVQLSCDTFHKIDGAQKVKE